MAARSSTATKTAKKRGRPKKGERRPFKAPLPKLSRRGRPTRDQELERAKLKIAAIEKHAAELEAKHAAELEREREQAANAKKQSEAMLAAGGPKEADPLAAVDRVFRMLASTADLAVVDPSLTGRERRAELRAIARSMHTLIPAARLLSAERVVRKAGERTESSAASLKPDTPHASAGPLQMPRRDG